MGLKVAIIGTVPVSKRIAPYDDDSWEIWVCSPGNSRQGAPPRITRWFELHSIVDMRGPENVGWYPDYISWLNSNAAKFQIVMQERNTDVPSAVAFPRQPLLDKWGESRGRTNWFTSSIAWMIAYAIHVGAEEIGIWGVDMAATEEHYSWQKAGCLRFIEIAKDLGIKVTIPLESTLASPFPLYGYMESSREGRAMRVRQIELKERIGVLENSRRNCELEAAFFRGALEQVEFQLRTFASGNEDAELDIEDSLPTLPGDLAAPAVKLPTLAVHDGFVVQEIQPEPVGRPQVGSFGSVATGLAAEPRKAIPSHLNGKGMEAEAGA